MKVFWTKLTPTNKAGLVIGAAAVIGATIALGYWSLGVDYVPVVSHASPDRLAASVREINKLKVPYRVSDDGTSIEVPANQLGRVRMGVANGNVGGPSVGFEIFNSTDFSTTEFTQHVNYQRALQGELSRTISSMDGISGARVHLVLAESGFLQRKSTSPTAAVTLSLQPGVVLAAEQVRGIQRLVAASVPEIKLKDIAILDQSGEALTKNSTGTDSEPGDKQLELKREVDAYLEAKLRRLLGNLDPRGDFNVSVDATLNANDVKVTTEDVLPSDDGKGGRATGVLVRERQSQRQESSAAGDVGGAAASGPSSGSVTRETEYRVGRRVEQVASAPGGIDRISVAVVARVPGKDLDEQRIKDLVAHAIGATDDRGDSVVVVFLPALAAADEQMSPAVGSPTGVSASQPQPSRNTASAHRLIWALAFLCVAAVVGVLTVMLRKRVRSAAPASELQEPTAKEIDEIVDQVRTWLAEGKPNAAR